MYVRPVRTKCAYYAYSIRARTPLIISCRKSNVPWISAALAASAIRRPVDPGGHKPTNRTDLSRSHPRSSTTAPREAMATPNPSVVPEAPAHVPADAAPADDGTGPAQAQTSSNPAPGGGGSTAVTAERKRALLLEARADRLAWVDGVASPFRPSGAGAGSGGTAADLLARLLGSTRAGRGSLGSAFGIAAALYGAPLSGEGGTEEGGWSGGLSRSEALERMRRQLESSLSTDEAKRLLEAAAADEDGAGGGASADPAYVAAYRTFLNRLREPEAADLVQGMKHFALAFRTQAGALVERSAGGREARPQGVPPDDGGSGGGGGLPGGCRDEDVRELASTIHKYIDKLVGTVQSHPLFKKAVGADDISWSVERTRQVLDTFIFAKCQESILSILSEGGRALPDDDADVFLEAKLDALQFVTPSHLDIPQLLQKGEGGGSSADLGPCDGKLEVPIAALRLIGRQFSPGMMLSCILGAHKGINDALSTSDGASPGADDLLPGLILSVLRARPCGILANLRYIDLFATEAQLRGEAGYAFTNLFGAVQFIKDMDVEQHASESNHDGKLGGEAPKVQGLSISPEDFRKGLERSAQAAKEKECAVSEVEEGREEEGKDEIEEDDEKMFNIPPQDVRDARARGETVDLDWARQWLEKNRSVVLEQRLLEREEKDSAPKPPMLPEGFTRSYSFVSSRPEDLRVSDITKLLEEYRMLVRATETLVGERAAKYNAEHKRHIRRKRDQIRKLSLGDF